ncbi:hypothetical protein [uncultured Mediterranean phage uvDeep-CGR2-KM21-C345]|nr:hypothetical protein [uncultured Mediterranean phage uvDeep-CGR2-KM21-C345]
MKTMTAFFNHIGEITLPLDIVSVCSCSHKSLIKILIPTRQKIIFDDVRTAIADIINRTDIRLELNKIDKESLKKELEQFGTWNKKELSNHNDNLARILWLASCDINEQIFDL